MRFPYALLDASGSGRVSYAKKCDKDLFPHQSYIYFTIVSAESKTNLRPIPRVNRIAPIDYTDQIYCTHGAITEVQHNERRSESLFLDLHINKVVVGRHSGSTHAR
jgi:hypothetical protein